MQPAPNFADEKFICAFVANARPVAMPLHKSTALSRQSNIAKVPRKSPMMTAAANN